MAYPISAYFGRETYAALAECAVCGKPYAETTEWHTVKGNATQADVWWIECDDCFHATTRKVNKLQTNVFLIKHMR